MGSLVTALASWIDARHHRGEWLLRIEDIDPPREVAGATEAIINSLKAHGLHWDGDLSCQSRHSVEYEAALSHLRGNNRLYACQCTRKQLRQEAARTGNSAYPGHCSELDLDETERPLRLRVKDEVIAFEDLHAGAQSENVSDTVGDFIVRRKDNLYAYQLAVVVDDARQNISHVVRGADLLDNSARQIALQEALSCDRPAYLHLPLVLNDKGSKLSKQTGADALDSSNALNNLQQAWRYLGQPALATRTRVSDFLAEATASWTRSRIPKIDTCNVSILNHSHNC